MALGAAAAALNGPGGGSAPPAPPTVGGGALTGGGVGSGVCGAGACCFCSAGCSAAPGVGKGLCPGVLFSLSLSDSPEPEAPVLAYLPKKGW